MIFVHVLIAWFLISFWAMVAWGLWCSFAGRRARRRQARFDRARDTLGREGL